MKESEQKELERYLEELNVTLPLKDNVAMITGYMKAVEDLMYSGYISTNHMDVAEQFRKNIKQNLNQAEKELEAQLKVQMSCIENIYTSTVEKKESPLLAWMNKKI